MKVVGFLGSPEKKGSTSKILRQILNGCAEKGARTKVYNLNKLKIRGCLGCGHCRKGDLQACRIPDDMQRLYQAIDEADAIIIGSPIYQWETTPQTKIFIDRLYAYFKGPGLETKIGDGKETILLYTQRENFADRYKSHFDQFENSLEILGFNIREVLVADTEEGKDVQEEPMLMKKAKTLGKDLIKSLR
ncbi:MAG: flavodoxin family protein [Spirochaetes bacterium]|nr:flavodoxin family protein [Spirochaetota bacterium]